MAQEITDILVIGGGINGTGIARDAAGRGFDVVLAEMGDLASGTSSGSTKLIHGGLRYLEHYEFRLVRESLFERERLWAAAPHIIWPLRFVLPHHKGQRPAWLLRLGLFLYDHMGGREALPPTSDIDLRTDPIGGILNPGHGRAFEYSDCWVDDSRLVVLNAQDAAEKGATIRTRTKVTAAQKHHDLWQVTLTDMVSGENETISARVIVNAAGPWVAQVLENNIATQATHKVRLVKGSHIVVKRLYDDERCFFFQNTDGRIFFAIPYQDDFTLIGTTDEDYTGAPENVRISEDEIAYLLDAANRYFAAPIGTKDIAWTYSAVRPLFDDGASKAQEATRDYVLKLAKGEGEAALLSVFGGKITTYRKLAEAALEKIESVLGKRGQRWTGQAFLPGGDFPTTGYEDLVARLRSACPFLPDTIAKAYVRRYGTRALHIVQGALSLTDLGEDFGAGLYGAEVDYLHAHEWARTPQDILWRRTKLGLYRDRIDIEALGEYLDRKPFSSSSSSDAGCLHP